MPILRLSAPVIVSRRRGVRLWRGPAGTGPDRADPSRRAIFSGESAGKSLGWDIGERPRLSQKYDRPMATSMMGLVTMQ